jgi:hypothetical protein
MSSKFGAFETSAALIADECRALGISAKQRALADPQETAMR